MARTALVLGTFVAVGALTIDMYPPALHVLASLLIMVAPTIATLGALRVLQVVGTAAGAVVALAAVRDLYDGRAAATMLSRLFLVMGAAPVLAPTIGGEVLRVTSWRGAGAMGAVILVTLLLATVVLLVVVRPWLLPDPEGTKGR